MLGSCTMLDVELVGTKDSQPSHEDPLRILLGFKPGECGIVHQDKELSASKEEFVSVDGKNKSQQFSLVGNILVLAWLQPSSIEGYRSFNTILYLRQDRANTNVQ